MPVNPVPKGYHTATPYLTVTGAARLMDFLKEAFGAVEKHRMMRPDGTVGHAEVRIGDSNIMIAEASEQWKPMPCAIYLYLPDVDAVYKRALKAGAKSIMEPADQFYGDRNGGVEDPSGNYWWISTHVEDISDEEIQRRAAAMAKG